MSWNSVIDFQLFFYFENMNCKVLILFLLLIFTRNYSQKIDLKELISLNNKSIGDFQEYAYGKDFLFYKTDSNPEAKVDTIRFINKQKLVFGIASGKKTNVVFLENINEDYFRELNQELNQPDFIFAGTKIKTKNTLEKKYLNSATENVIDVNIISDTEGLKNIKNTYKVMVTKESKYNFKRILNKIPNKK